MENENASRSEQNSLRNRVKKCGFGLLSFVILLVLYVVILWCWVDLEETFHVKDYKQNKYIRYFYFAMVTISTVGYGDVVFKTKLLGAASIVFCSTLIRHQLDVVLTEIWSILTERLSNSVSMEDGVWNRVRKKLPIFLLVVGSTIVLFVIGCFIAWDYEEITDLKKMVYLIIVSITTVGYGDKSFLHNPGRSYIGVWLIFGPFVANKFVESSFKLICHLCVTVIPGWLISVWDALRNIMNSGWLTQVWNALRNIMGSNDYQRVDEESTPNPNN